MNETIASGKYVFQGHQGLVFRVPTENTVPLYAEYAPARTEHYYSTSQAEIDLGISKQGYVTQGTAAYVYATQICGSIPLYYLWIPGKDNFYTTNETQRENAIKAGYRNEGVACYVLPDL